jgi:hypothetical protein
MEYIINMILLYLKIYDNINRFDYFLFFVSDQFLPINYII